MQLSLFGLSLLNQPLHSLEQHSRANFSSDFDKYAQKSPKWLLTKFSTLLISWRLYLHISDNASIRLFHVKIATVPISTECLKKWIIMQIYHVKSSLGNCMGCTEISMYYIKSCCKFLKFQAWCHHSFWIQLRTPCSNLYTCEVISQDSFHSSFS